MARRKQFDAEKTPDPHKIGARRPSELRIGDMVRYYPILPPVNGIDSRDVAIRSEPWQLGHGAWVVKIEGTAGGVACEHCGAIR
jgi:hypothetical protein